MDTRKNMFSKLVGQFSMLKLTEWVFLEDNKTTIIPNITHWKLNHSGNQLNHLKKQNVLFM